jgi:hypothetical protein
MSKTAREETMAATSEPGAKEQAPKTAAETAEDVVNTVVDAEASVAPRR